jgi:hypothetical protein
MMQTSQMQRRHNSPPEYGPSYWRILVQSEVGPRQIMILRVGKEDMAQISSIEDDDMVETLPSDRTDQTFREPILPG